MRRKSLAPNTMKFCFCLTPRRPVQDQAGNALLIILIAVALFGALMFAMTQSRTTFTGATSQEEARIIATEMIQYGDTIRNAVNKLLLVGGAKFGNSSDTSPSFYTAGVSTDYQTAGPSRLEVFSMDGGGVSYQKPPEDACVSTCAYDFAGGITIPGVGDDNLDDLAMVVQDVDPLVCKRINDVQKTGWSSIPTFTPFQLEAFSGINFCDTGGCSFPQNFGVTFSGKRSFCYRENASGQRYIFVHVIRSR